MCTMNLTAEQMARKVIEKVLLNQGHGSITNDKEGIEKGIPDHELGG